MRSNRGTDGSSVAIHHIEHARREASFMKNLREQIRGEWRNLAGLEDHGAPGGKRGRHLADNLVHGPIPRGNEAAHADRLFSHKGRTLEFLELKVAQNLHDL